MAADHRRIKTRDCWILYAGAIEDNEIFRLGQERLLRCYSFTIQKLAMQIIKDKVALRKNVSRPVYLTTIWWICYLRLNFDAIDLKISSISSILTLLNCNVLCEVPIRILKSFLAFQHLAVYQVAKKVKKLSNRRIFNSCPFRQLKCHIGVILI